MNERIRQLSLEAGVQDNPDLLGLDLFAELIARDICKIVRGQKLVAPEWGFTEWDEGYNTAVKSAVTAIKRQYKKAKNERED